MDSVSSHSVATFPVLRRRHPDIFRKHPHEMRQVVEADRIANSDTRFGECFSSSRTIFKRYCVTNCEKVISLHNIIQLPRSVTVQLGFETRLHALVDEEKRMALRFGRIRKTPPDQMSSGAPKDVSCVFIPVSERPACCSDNAKIQKIPPPQILD